MPVTRVLAGAALLTAVILAVVLTIWLWRDMRERRRPVWLRLLVVATGFVTGLGIVVWMVDLRRHPHDPALSRQQIALQRFGRPAA